MPWKRINLPHPIRIDMFGPNAVVFEARFSRKRSINRGCCDATNGVAIMPRSPVLTYAGCKHLCNVRTWAFYPSNDVFSRTALRSTSRGYAHVLEETLILIPH